MHSNEKQERSIDQPPKQQLSPIPQLPSPIQVLKWKIVTRLIEKRPPPVKGTLTKQGKSSRRSSILHKHAAEVAERSVAENATNLVRGQSASCEYHA